MIVGGGAEAEELIKALEASHDTDIRIAGIFDDRGNERVSPVIAGYPKLGNIDELVEFARNSRIDLLIVSLPVTAEKRLLQLLKKLWVLPVDIRLSAHSNRLRFRPRTYSYIGNVPFIDVADKPIADWDHVKKWLFDKAAASLALILLAPLMAIIAILIKLDSKGPVLFRQKRQGFNNELIEVFKFRSMYAAQADVDANKLVTKDDPRVTRIGRFLRRTSLDELPQFFNVLKGDLSLVGPRPHALKAKAEDKLYSEVVDGYFARHRVKPGVTGWAQISGWRGETDTEEKIERRVEHDLYYIENWSVTFDLYLPDDAVRAAQGRECLLSGARDVGLRRDRRDSRICCPAPNRRERSAPGAPLCMDHRRLRRRGVLRARALRCHDPRRGAHAAGGRPGRL